MTLLDLLIHLLVSIIINPWRACAEKVTVLGLCVSVPANLQPQATRWEKKAYQRPQCYVDIVLNGAFFLKRLRSKLWRETRAKKPICK